MRLDREKNGETRQSALWGKPSKGETRSSALWGKPGRGFVAMALVVALVPHAWKYMHINRIVRCFHLATILHIFTFSFNIGLHDLLFNRAICPVLSFHDRPVAVLLTSKITHEVHRVVNVKHVNGRVCV